MAYASRLKSITEGSRDKDSGRTWKTGLLAVLPLTRDPTAKKIQQELERKLLGGLLTGPFA